MKQKKCLFKLAKIYDGNKEEEIKNLHSKNHQAHISYVLTKPLSLITAFSHVSLHLLAKELPLTKKKRFKLKNKKSHTCEEGGAHLRISVWH